MSLLDEGLTGHNLKCPQCGEHLTSLLLCPECGDRYTHMTQEGLVKEYLDKIKINIKILDDNGFVWLWNGEWIDIDHRGDPDSELVYNSGYPATTFEEVCKILIEGGYIEP